jgi:5-methylcytosine-specific restriction endonuclease McrBC regulatory subunit McrC
MDTKWKLLTDDGSEKYGISQADMYQMYAYHKRFENAKKVILLYPSLLEGNERHFETDENAVQIFAKYLQFKDGDFDVKCLAELLEIVQNSQNSQNNVNL